ncbi:hypothetical protein ACJX0J_007389 [Zea mays]
MNIICDRIEDIIILHEYGCNILKKYGFSKKIVYMYSKIHVRDLKRFMEAPNLNKKLWMTGAPLNAIIRVNHFFKIFSLPCREHIHITLLEIIALEKHAIAHAHNVL